MANKHRGEVAITLPIAGREKQFALRPTFEFIATVEEECDCGLWELTRRLSDGDWRVAELITVLTAGLGHDDSIDARDVRDAVMALGPVKLVAPAVALCANAISAGDARPEPEPVGNGDGEAGPATAS